VRLYLDQCLRSELAGLLPLLAGRAQTEFRNRLVIVSRGARVGFGRLRNNQWPEILRKFGRRAGTLAPADLGQLAGGMGCAAVARALARLGRGMERTPELGQKMATVQKQM
jgi:hypothetical protein